MPKTKKSKPTKKTTPSAPPRRFKKSAYKSFKVSKRIKPEPTKALPSAFALSKSAYLLIKNNAKLFFTITLIYGLLTIVLVRGVGGGLDLSDLKANLQDGFSGSYASLITGLTLFSYLIGSAGASASPAGGAYQTMLIILISLVVIWALRQVLAKHKISAREAFYKAPYPIVPFVLVLLLVSLQLLPLLVGSWIYSVAVSGGIAVTAAERFLWAVFALLLATLSLYMICSSIFALYIVTLPEMTPLKALRSARQLVLHRRWAVLRKIIFLPIALLILGGIIMTPIILLAVAAAEWLFFFLSMFTLVVVHTYMYTLYRELL